MRTTTTSRRLLAAGILLALASVPAAAQTPARGFFTLSAAAQAAANEITDRNTFEMNAETATVDTRYPSSTAVLFDGGIGYRLRGPMGAALAVSHGTSSGAAEVRASLPHPFFDDRDRIVEGEASDVSRTERRRICSCSTSCRPPAAGVFGCSPVRAT